MTRGIFSGGILAWGDFFLGGFCPGGGFVRGDFVLSPPGGPAARGTGGPSVFFVTTLLTKCMSISVTLSDYAFPFQCLTVV